MNMDRAGPLDEVLEFPENDLVELPKLIIGALSNRGYLIGHRGPTQDCDSARVFATKEAVRQFLDNVIGICQCETCEARRAAGEDTEPEPIEFMECDNSGTAEEQAARRAEPHESKRSKP